MRRRCCGDVVVVNFPREGYLLYGIQVGFETRVSLLSNCFYKFECDLRFLARFDILQVTG